MDERDWFWQHDLYWLNAAMERYEQANTGLSLEEYTYNLIMEEERNEKRD